MSALEDLQNTVARLRGPGGCPWDIAQTHQSLSACLVEETCELLDTIDRLDMPHMREELGDVLLQVVMHAQIAQEAGAFDLEAVAAGINEKLIRRHPHVFGGASATDEASALQQWDAIKAAEKANGQGGPTTAAAGASGVAAIFKDLPTSLPALLRARDVFKQMQKKKLPMDGVVDMVAIETWAEALDEIEAGEILFELAAACRLASIDPEAALRRHCLAVQEGVSARAG